MTTKNVFVTTAIALVSMAGLSAAAHATPYAFASNQINGLRITNADGTSITTTATPTTSISDSAQFDGYPVSGFQMPGTVGTASSISQAYSGPGPAPAATYTPAGPGSFTGSRADAAIGAGTAAGGGVSVSNVAEGYGNALGNSVGTNNAAIRFTVTGTGQALSVSFSDLIQLIAATAAVSGESANAAIANTFSITPSNSNTPIYSSNLTDINRQISSTAGTPASNSVGPTTLAEAFLTPVLMSGTSYNIALTSTASETIQPGTPVSTPEPASLALLGAGLVAFGVLRRRAAG